MSDLIDREATIEDLWHERDKLNEFMDKCLAAGEYGLRAEAKTERNRIEEDIYILQDMPSAQVDLIAKIQNGIKITDADDAYSCGMRNGMRWCLSLIDDKEPLYENCPSAQPERKKGKWKEEIDTGERMLACSACGGRVFLETYETAVGEHGYRFCPYCGADMRQGEQE